MIDKDVIEGVPPRGQQVIQGGQAPQGVQFGQGQKVPIVGEGDEVVVVPPNMTNGHNR